MLLHAQAVLAHGGMIGTGWASAMDALSTLRMPTFFLISGLFAKKSFTVQPSDFRRRKVWNFLWIYTLWSLVYILPLELIGWVSGAGVFLGEADEWIDETFMVNGVLWYLVALPVFFLAARLLRHVRVWVQISCAGAVSFALSSGLISLGQWGADRMAANFVYFLTGCYFSSAIRAAAVRAGWRFAAAAGLVWTGLSVAVFFEQWPGISATDGPNIGRAILPLLAVPFVLTSAPFLARRVWAGPLVWLGRNTLPVYVMHLAPIYLFAFVLQHTHVVAAGSRLATATLPILVTGAAVVIILGIRPLLVRWAPWSLRLPAGIAGHEGSGGRVRGVGV